MAEKRKKIQLVAGGPLFDGVEVSIDESSERWSEYKLADGTTIRMKQVLMDVTRVEGQYDNDGNPTYQVKSQPIVAVVDVPDKLKRKTN